MFANHYFLRFSADSSRLTPSNFRPDIIVVIPVFKEKELFHTLDSLFACEVSSLKVQLILVFNSSETASAEDVAFNQASYERTLRLATTLDKNHWQLSSILVKDLPKKKAGVGAARKIGMDEAVRIFNQHDEAGGVIASLDADCLVQANYFLALAETFKEQTTQLAILHFEHPLAGDYPAAQYQAIAEYELYLRFYVHALRYAGFPYGNYTLGANFALRADLYCAHGGMNRKQAGEDFYFLHKLFPVCKLKLVTNTTVFPSSRTSDRVPFGTGKVVAQILKNKSYTTYEFRAFKDLSELFKVYPLFFKQSYADVAMSLAKPVQAFLLDSQFQAALDKMRSHSSSLAIFRQRFFQWCTAFRLFKFLNDSTQLGHYKKVPVLEASQHLAACLSLPVCKTAIDQLKEFRSYDTRN